jgi:hypothetical protein
MLTAFTTVPVRRFRPEVMYAEILVCRVGVDHVAIGPARAGCPDGSSAHGRLESTGRFLRLIDPPVPLFGNEISPSKLAHSRRRKTLNGDWQNYAHKSMKRTGVVCPK